MTFYQEGNASGRRDPYEGETGGISVKALTLSEIVLASPIQHVDMLDLDCEGSEYGIILDTPPEVWDRIGRVVLEYHNGQSDQIGRRFQDLGFRLTRFQLNSYRSGLMWFER